MTADTNSSAPFRGIALSVALFLFGSTFNANANAADIGTYGNVWAIKEIDAREYIREKAAKFMQTEYGTWRKNTIEAGRKYLERPTSVFGIARATEERKFVFNTTYRVPRDIRAPDGTLIAGAGTTVNPARSLRVISAMVFIDGDDEEQVNWALKRPLNDRIVLVSGSPLELAKKHNRPFYFDQNGTIVNKVGILNVPAVMKQERSEITVHEIPIDDGAQR